MLAIALAAATAAVARPGVRLSASSVTLSAKIDAACAQLGIDRGPLTVPAALKACHEALGVEHEGPLLAQADALVEELGLMFPPPPPLRASAPSKEPAPPPPPPKRDPSMPRLVVFDLDFTLWQPELYQLSSGPPFKACSDGCVLTTRGERLDLFPAARAALRELADAGVPVAIASRASEASWAMEIMRLLRVDKRRTVADVVGSSPVVIQGGSKVKHLKHIASETGVPLHDILFFDNERSNIAEVEKIGPTCVYCPRGMKDGVYRDGLAQHLGSTSSGRRRRRGGDDAPDGDGIEGVGAAGSRRSKRGANEKKSRKSGRRGGRKC